MLWVWELDTSQSVPAWVSPTAVGLFRFWITCNLTHKVYTCLDSWFIGPLNYNAKDRNTVRWKTTLCNAISILAVKIKNWFEGGSREIHFQQLDWFPPAYVAILILLSRWSFSHSNMPVICLHNTISKMAHVGPWYWQHDRRRQHQFHC